MEVNIMAILLQAGLCANGMRYALKAAYSG